MRKIIFFVLILGLILVVAGVWFWQKNSYSKEVLKLEIIAPQEVSILDEVEYTLKYKNNGDLRLEEPKLVFEFPEYTLAPLSADSGSDNQPMPRKEMSSQELGGDIYPGEEKVVKFKVRLFGKEGDIKTAKASISYKPKNLSVRYESTTTATSVVKPINFTFDFDLPSKIESGRKVNFLLNYFSSLSYPLTNLGIKIQYPSGFEFESSKPKSLDKGEWEISLLNKTDGGRIEIDGTLNGSTKDQKVFKAQIGVWQNDNTFIVLKEATKIVEIGEPKLAILQKVNNSDDYTAVPGEILHYEIFFRNMGEESFSNLFLIVKLDGKLFDFNSIKTDSGKFSAGDNSIVWDYNNVSKLQFLNRGEEGKVEFWVNLKNTGDQNATVNDSVLLSQTKEDFTVKIKSQLNLVQNVFYNDEAFGNTGANPPEAGKATTYTVMWQVKNYGNSVKNTTVKATLPNNVKLTGLIFPEDQSSNFSFDNQSREIVWKVNGSGNIDANSGTAILAFQVSLTPDLIQKGQNAIIINEAKIKGEDQWTDNVTGNTARSVTTSSLSDPDNKGGAVSN